MPSRGVMLTVAMLAWSLATAIAAGARHSAAIDATGKVLEINAIQGVSEQGSMADWAYAQLEQTDPELAKKLPASTGRTSQSGNWLGIYWSGRIENGIHGLPYNPSTGRKTWAGMVGVPITFGCIMLDDANAKTLFDVAYIGMPVVILP